MKVCGDCAVEKPTEDFPSNGNKLYSLCRACVKLKSAAYYLTHKKQIMAQHTVYCHSNPARGRAYQRKYRETHPDVQRNNKYRRRYGITLDNYNVLLEAQDGKCKICGISGVRLAVDHCHKTVRIRSLLCDLCNRGLGYFKENAVVLRMAADYLECHTGGISNSYVVESENMYAANE